MEPGMSNGGYDAYRHQQQQQEQYQQQYHQYYPQAQQYPQQYYQQQVYQQQVYRQPQQVQQREQHYQQHPQHRQNDEGGQQQHHHHHRGRLSNLGHRLSLHRHGAGSHSNPSAAAPTSNAMDRMGGGFARSGAPASAPAMSGAPEVSDALYKKRERKGLCPTCGIKLFSIHPITRKKSKVKRADGVVSGTCLKCSGINDGYTTPTGKDAKFGYVAGDGRRTSAAAGGGGVAGPSDVHRGMMNPPVGPGHGAEMGGGAMGAGQIPQSGIVPPLEIEATPTRGVTPQDDNFTIISGLTLDQTMMVPNPMMFGGGAAGVAPRLMPALNEDGESENDRDAGEYLNGLVQGAGGPGLVDMTRNSSRILMDDPGISTRDLDALEGFDLDSSRQSGSSPGNRLPSEPVLLGPRPGPSSDSSGQTDSVVRAGSASSAGDSSLGFNKTPPRPARREAAPREAPGRANDGNGRSGGGGENDNASGLGRGRANAEESRGEDPSNPVVSTERFRSDNNSSFPRVAEMQQRARAGSQDLEGFDQDLSGFEFGGSADDLTNDEEPEDHSAYGASRPLSIPGAVERGLQPDLIDDGVVQRTPDSLSVDGDARKGPQTREELLPVSQHNHQRQANMFSGGGGGENSGEHMANPETMNYQGLSSFDDEASELERRRHRDTASVPEQTMQTAPNASLQRFDVGDEHPGADMPPPRGTELSRNAYGSNEGDEAHHMTFTETEALEAAASAADAAAAALDPTGYLADVSRWESLQAQDLDAGQWRKRQFGGRADNFASTAVPTETHPGGRRTGDCVRTDAGVGGAQLKRGDSLEDEAAVDRELRERLLRLAADGPLDLPQSRLDEEPLPSSAAEGPQARAAAVRKDVAAKSSSHSPDERSRSSDSQSRPPDVHRFVPDSLLLPRHPVRMDSHQDAPSARSLNLEEEKVEIDEKRDPVSFHSSLQSPNYMISPVDEEKPSQARNRKSGTYLAAGGERVAPSAHRQKHSDSSSDSYEKASSSSVSTPLQSSEPEVDNVPPPATHTSESTDASAPVAETPHDGDAQGADYCNPEEGASSNGDDEHLSRSGRQSKPLVKDIPTILRCLEMYPDNPLVHERAYEALYELASLRDPRGKINIIANGGIQATVGGIWRHMEVPSVQVSALYALWALSAAEDGARPNEAMARSNGDGVVDAVLISMQEHERNAAVQLAGCGVLSCLASSASRSSGVDDGTSSGAMSTLINAMRMHSQSLDVQEWGLRALYYECSNSDRNKMDFITADAESEGSGGIEILQQVSSSFPSDLIIQEWVCRIYHCLSTDERAAEHMSASAVPVQSVVRAMKSHGRKREGVSLVEAACGMLGNLAASVERNNASIRNEGGVRAIIDAMSHFPSSVGVQASACAALADLSARAETRADILQMGGIDAIIASLQQFEGNHRIQEEACRVLCYLFVEAKAEEEDAPGSLAVSVAVRTLRSHPEDEGVQEAACSLLAVLAADVSLHNVILSSGAVDQVSRAMTRHSTQRNLQEQCCAVLRNLSASASNQDAILRSDAVNAVIRSMIAHSDSEAVQENACCMFWNLTCDSKADPATIIDAGEIKYIIIAMQNHPESSKVQSVACGALWSLLSTSDVIKEAVANCGGVDAIMCSMFMYEHDPEVLEKACGVFSSLSMDRRHAKAIADAGIIGLIIESMRNNINSIALVEYGCLLLRNMALFNTNYAEEASSACSTILRAMCEHSDACGLQREACGALWSLAANSETCKERILYSDGVNVITRTMQTFSTVADVQVEAQGAMSQLVIGQK